LNAINILLKCVLRSLTLILFITGTQNFNLYPVEGGRLEKGVYKMSYMALVQVHES